MVEAQGFLMKVYVIPENIQGVPSLKLTVRTQKYAIPKGNWYSNHPFSGAMLVFGGVTCKEKLDPKWVPERAKHSGRKIWHEMKGPWRLSPIEHNPKITNLFSRRAFLVTPRWWRSTWRFPITDHSWNVDIHARKSKRGRRANVKSNNSRQISQVK